MNLISEGLSSAYTFAKTSATNMLSTEAPTYDPYQQTGFEGVYYKLSPDLKFTWTSPNPNFTSTSPVNLPAALSLPKPTSPVVSGLKAAYSFVQNAATSMLSTEVPTHYKVNFISKPANTSLDTHQQTGFGHSTSLSLDDYELHDPVQVYRFVHDNPVFESDVTYTNSVYDSDSE